jgi:hypothetical protein
MDYMVDVELAGSERSAASAIMSSRTAGEAGAAIVNRFLRPAEEHRARREASYLGGGAPPSARVSLAQSFNRLWLDFGGKGG